MAKPSNLSLFDSAGITASFDLNQSPEFNLTTEEKVFAAKESIRRTMRDSEAILLASSFGKDSTVLVHLALAVEMEMAAAGERVPHILITHAHTGIDNPEMTAVARGEISRVRAFAATHGLPVEVDIAEPSLNDSWAVRIISGRSLPTFVNSSSRDCAIQWKQVPQERQRKQALKRLGAMGKSVLMTGVRFEESLHRFNAMRQRGERADQVWIDADGRANLSPIAYFSQEDVWVVLAGLQSGQVTSYTDATAVWQFYQDAGNSSCAVVGDDFMKANSKACGARSGCAICVAVGRDKSMEAMLEADDKYSYMRPLNRLQRFLVDSQYDLARRQWVGRTISDDGYIPIAPDVYSPAMLREILQYALTIDRDEQAAAAKLGIEPRFQLVTLSQLIAIDVFWSISGIQPRAFEAMRIWQSVYGDGRTFVPPDISQDQLTKAMPEAKWLWVGADWDADLGGRNLYSGARSLSHDLASSTSGLDQSMNRVTKDGRQILDGQVSRMFEVDEEAAADFMLWEIMDRLLLDESKDWSPTYAWLHYKSLGIFSTSAGHQAEQDSMARRGEWRMRHGINGMSVQLLLAKSVSNVERAAQMRAPVGQQTLNQTYRIRVDAEHARRQATLKLGQAAFDIPLEEYMRDIAARLELALVPPAAPKLELVSAPAQAVSYEPVQLDLLELAA